MNLKTTVVVNETHLPEFVHEGTDPRSRRTHHLSQSSLADLGNFSPFFYTVLAEAREQQQNAGEPFLAGIEKLIDKVFAVPKILGQEMFHEQVGKLVL